MSNAAHRENMLSAAIAAKSAGGIPGMSLRDWFAGQALAGMMGQVDLAADNVPSVAVWAFKAADAMLAARVPSHSLPSQGDDRG